MMSTLTTRISQFISITTLLLASVWVSSAAAQTPHELVETVTQQLMSEVETKRHLLDSDPQGYFDAVGGVLESVVDFRYIATSVMGPYAKQASAEQRERFEGVFKGGLISTYAKGMASFGDLDIVVLPPEQDISGQRRVSVHQDATGKDGNVSRISYTMGLNREGEWKLINVVLNGINLGKTFRSQFMQSMKRLGTIDAVIADWDSGVDEQAAIASSK